jgi:D-alanyl-D-alanine carboxypeptidase/D-alanyl-D-alanine-endopeptidase (penicillin-binding protein 4)
MFLYNTILILILQFNLSSFSQTLTEIDSLILKYKNQTQMIHAQWSLSAKYVDKDDRLIDYNSQYSLAPASGLKLITTASAFHYLGEDYKFETKIYYTGEIDKNGNLKGDIIIVGGGDPTLGSDRVEGSLSIDSLLSEIAGAVKKAGIKKVQGSVFADDFHFDRIPIPGEWIWMDIGNYYGASTSALSFNENTYTLYFKTGKNEGEPTEILRVEPEIDNLTFENYIKTGSEGSGDNGYIYRSPGQYNAVLQGTLPPRENEFSIKGSIPDPALFTAEKLTEKLIELNITVYGKASKVLTKQVYDEKKSILVISSPPLKNIIFHLNKRSINLYTEHILKEIGCIVFGLGTTENGIKAINQYFNNLGISTDGMKLFDGSGLSRSNMITSYMMVEMLSKIRETKYFDSFYNSLAVAGDPNDLGFFKNLGKGTLLENNLRLKSGLIDRVRSFSGYLKDKKERLIAFSFIANNFNGSHRSIDKFHEAILLQLANLN